MKRERNAQVFDTNINIYTCQLFSELNSSELIARVFARAATTVDTDASEPRLDGGLLVLSFHKS